MKPIKRIVGFTIVFVAVVLALTLLLKPPSGLRVLLNEAKTNEYDTLIIGQSHSESGYNPYIISDELNCNAVNISRRIIPINFIYYMIVEANKDGQYKTVILDIDPQYWIVANNRGWGDDMNLFPYLTGLRRWKYFKEVMWADQYSVLFTDYNISYEHLKKIPYAVKAKCNLDYISNNKNAMNHVNEYLGTNNAFIYMGRGYYYGVNYVTNTNVGWQYDDSVQAENIEILDRIVEYCRENNIRLICTESALAPSLLNKIDLGKAHDEFGELLKQRGIDYVDFNYAKKEYLDRTDWDYVDLEEHEMGELSSRQSKLLCEILKSEDKVKYFYVTYDEVLANL